MDATEYAALSRNGRTKYTSDAFYAYLLAQLQLRQQCQDSAVLKAEFLKWRATAIAPNGTKCVGAYSEILWSFRRRNRITKRGAGNHDNTIVWSIDVKDGRTAADVRRTASAFVREKRAQIEADKFGARVGPVVGMPESASVGKEVRCTVRVENTRSTTLVLGAARFLQSIGSRAATSVFQARVPGHRWPVHILPRTSVEVEILCIPLFGITRDVLELDFGDFSVGRFVEVSAGDELLFDALKPVSPFKKKKRGRNPLLGVQVVSEGEKPRHGAPPWQRDAGDHEIPGKLEGQLRSGEVEEALKPLRERMVEDPLGIPLDLATDYPR
jgi:hypothetical protein